MKIQLFSDLHIEFDAFEANCHNADVVVFAGDIHTGAKGIEWIRQQKITCPVIYVLGNHEYYRYAYPSLIEKVKASTQGREIYVLENESITLDGVCFHGATLWTNFELFGDARLTGARCQEVMNDFKLIRRAPSYSRLRSVDAAMIHSDSLKWLTKSLQSSTAKTNVVISHHAPSVQSIPLHFQTNIIAAAYASNLEAFILEHNIACWLHGHIHSSSDYCIGRCRVVCNPRGYIDGERNFSFEQHKLISL